MIKKFETKPQTIFAPKGVYYIFEDKLNLDFDKIKTVILKKEKEIIKKYPSSSDGDTGLGDSLTSRHPYFNLFDWPEMSNLKKSVRLSPDNFLKELDQNIFTMLG